MPIKIKHAFEREYGHKKGDKIFYAWENKHHMLHSHPERTLHEELRERHEMHRMHHPLLQTMKESRREAKEVFGIHPHDVRKHYPY